MRVKIVDGDTLIADSALTNMASSLAGALLDSKEEKFKQLFMQMDLNGNGLIDKFELKSALDGAGETYSEQQVNRSIDR